MSAVPCTVAADTRRHLSSVDSKAAAYEVAHAFLAGELLDALLTDPARIVSTPGYSPQAMSAADIVLDAVFGDDGDEIKLCLARALSLAAEAGDEQCIRIRALICKDHAEFHADEQATVGD